MKKSNLLLLFVLSLLACEQDPLFTTPPACIYQSEILAPEGYQIETIGTIAPPDLDVSISKFKFLNEQLGFALGSNNSSGSSLKVFKTEDGGKSWKTLEVSPDLAAHEMLFIDEQLGFLLANKVSDCSIQPGCKNSGFLIKTEDGGDSWEEIEFPGPNSILGMMEMDDNGTLFASMRVRDSALNQFQFYLLKSLDRALTWDTVSIPTGLPQLSRGLSFELYGNHVYLYGREGEIVMIDKTGNLIKTLDLNEVGQTNFSVIDDKLMIAENTISGIAGKSTDGGETWELLYRNRSRLIDVNSEDEMIAILNKSVCVTDYYQGNDVLAFSKDGGASWVEADDYATFFASNFIGSQKMGEGRYLILIKDKLMELREN